MVKNIEILFSNTLTIKEKIEIDCVNNMFLINGRKKVVTQDIIDTIISIISSWKNEYGYSNNIDDEEFTITLITEKERILYHGKGIYPYNYTYLKKIIGDVYV